MPLGMYIRQIPLAYVITVTYVKDYKIYIIDTKH